MLDGLMHTELAKMTMRSRPRPPEYAGRRGAHGACRDDDEELAKMTRTSRPRQPEYAGRHDAHGACRDDRDLKLSWILFGCLICLAGTSFRRPHAAGKPYGHP